MTDDQPVGPPADPEVVGRTLMRWRHTFDRTREWVADVISLDVQAVVEIEGGTRDITLREACAFADALGVSLEALRFEPTDLLRAFAQAPPKRAMERDADDL